MTKRTAKLTGGNKIYIPGLNGVRAIAALIVLFSHIDEYSYRFGLPAIGLFEKGMAGYGVTIFFTLSGFLITYLLLIEKKGGISIKRFYVRRILRIWPLYYLVIIIGILLLLFLPQVKAQGNPIYGLAMFVCFLPNLAYTLGMTLTTITPLWSVGVEEQFYLIWPWLVKKSDNILKASLGVIIVYFIVKLIARYTGNSYSISLYGIRG
ncbi:MAG TPA: acyltransferase [Puia sp.]|jgi:peptidoglycan/LPS O-acetylase OafA/YrhL